MPTISCITIDKKILETSTQAKAFFVPETDSMATFATEHCAPHQKIVTEYTQQREFTGKKGSRLAVPVEHNGQLVSFLFIGLGKKNTDGVELETYRRAVGNLIRIAEVLKLTSISVELPVELVATTKKHLVHQTGLIAHMAGYKFDEFVTDKPKEHAIALELCVQKDEVKELQEALDEGALIAGAVNQTRCWIDTPPSKLTPPQLAQKAKEIADKHKLPITIFNEEQIKKMGMGGLAGVSAGSHQDCRFVAMEYIYDKEAPTLAFVGKGITFDSGGLSIKPASGMENMKDDMSGAAAVINVMDVIAALKPKVNVIGITPLAENLPSGTATKPGDVLTFYNGKTAEVKNTDAEGRLVLADGLSYAVKHYKPTAIIDVATLTGACAYFLGPFFSAIMGKDIAMLNRVKRAGAASGDRVWELPFSDDYRPAIKSNIADISNTGSLKYKAGTITAGFFLYNFVGDTPWVHVDIAGTAFNVPDISYLRPQGATGAGVRLLIEVVRAWSV